MAEDKKDIILSIRGMSKSFGRNKVLKHIDLDVKKGSIMGLMGENGAGKSTMMKCLFGTYQKDEGTIILDGKEINFTGPKDALENGVAMVHQELNQCLERNVIDNLFLGRYPKNSLGVVDEGRMKKEASDLFRKLGITVNLSQPMKKMSVSKRQMCEIAKAISYNARVIVLDEPTNHLDIDGREALINALNEYNGSVILITHDIHLIELIADNLWLVKDGCCRPYDGDLADYRNLLLAKTEPEKKVKPKPEVPKVNVREERKSVSARLRRVEREMEKLNADRAAIEAAFQTPLTSEEIIRSQKELAWISAALGEYEEEWLELSERLEQLGQ